MSKNISQLRAMWDKEKTHYQIQEIGSGSQKFAKEVLKSEQIFSLKEGLKSTSLQNRRYEFLEEEKSKEHRKPDVTIFISPDIIIPVEIERYMNIQVGEGQLFNYQIDLEKKYGILTDGYNWRFYNNNIYRLFNLDYIFSDTEEFLEFWKEYTKPESYYLSFFEITGQLSLLRKVETLNVENNRQLFFEDITKLIQGFKRKLNLEGYFEELEKRERDKKATEITYAYIIQFILYKTLVDNKFGEFSQEFEQIVDSIYNCLKTNQYGKILGVIEGISNRISENVYRPFAEEQKFITKTLLSLIRQPKNDLHEVSPWLDIFVFIKKYNFSNIKNEIFGYIYENYLKELYEEKQKGQYFTDPSVVNFMLKQIGYNENNLKKRLKNLPSDKYISIIDPACGSGTFLYSATDILINSIPDGSRKVSDRIKKLINNNIFGLDISEFPLYLTEMNILMRLLPLIITEKYNNPLDKKIKVFKTKDSISEFLDTKLRYIVQKVKRKQTGFFEKKLDLGYLSYVRDKIDLGEMKNSLEGYNQMPRRRFDFVIGNPPYVGYNECSKQGVLIIKLIQQKEVQMSDIYGVNLNTVPGRIKAYSPKPNIYAFFIALGIALLKDEGKLCYIIPQTILFSNDLDVLRYHLAKYVTIEKLITFSCKLFVSRGLRQNRPVPTSSLIFVVNQKKPKEGHEVEVINYLDANDSIESCLHNMSIGRKTSKKQIKQNILLDRLNNWNFIKYSNSFLDFYTYYMENSEDISYLRSKLSRHNDFFFDGGVTIDENKIIGEPKMDCFELFDQKNNNWNLYSVTKSSQFYPKDASIKFPEGSQGIETFLRKFKIIWRTRYPKKFQFSEREILLVNNPSLTVTSNSKKYLLFYFAILNSPITEMMLDRQLRQENERNYLVPLRAIKNLIRVPEITNNNQYIIKEIMTVAEHILNLENVKFNDLVDFTGILKQKFEFLSAEGEYIILYNSGGLLKCKILKDRKLIHNILKTKFFISKLLDNKKITLSELKSLTVIDFEKQNELKDYMDDLVFALYFKIILGEINLAKANKIKRLCKKNKFYSLIEEFQNSN